MDTSIEYYAINRNGTEEVLEEEVFSELLLEPDENLLRLLLRFDRSVVGRDFEGFNIFDTPGFNSLTQGHREVLEEFLPESDIIVFVCGYRSGFGQNEQDLLELIRKMVSLDPDVPVVLVINRVPKNTTMDDKRIQEIRDNAKDCLFREPPCFIIRSRNPDDGLPDTKELWDFLHKTVQDPKRVAFIENKLVSMGLRVLQNAKARISESYLAMGLSDEEKEFMKQELQEFARLQDKAYAMIDKFDQKMQKTLPKMLKVEIKKIKSSLDEDIDRENKWINKDSCYAFVDNFLLPKAVRELSRNIEFYLFNELEKLNQHLEDLVNTTVQQLEHQAHLQGGNVALLMDSITARIVQELGGAALNGMLRNVGGVGGAAAGAGNVAKMALKRFGNLFNQTFSREAHAAVGRFFNNKMMARLGVIVQVVVEVVIFIKDAKTWQRDLKKNLHKSFDQWEEEVKQNLHRDLIEQYVQGNKDSITEIISSFTDEIEEKLAQEESNTEKTKLLNLQQQLENLEKQWSIV